MHPTAQLLNLTLCLSNALGAGIDSPSALTINLEARIDEDVQRALEARGHILNVHDPWAAFFGGMQGAPDPAGPDLCLALSPALCEQTSLRVCRHLRARVGRLQCRRGPSEGWLRCRLLTGGARCARVLRVGDEANRQLLDLIELRPTPGKRAASSVAARSFSSSAAAIYS